MEKIDAFCHTMPKPYHDRFFALDTSPAAANIRRRVSKIPSLVDMDLRFRQMDEFGDYRQVINIAAPPVEDLGSTAVSKEISRVGNEAMAELVARHPDRFAGFMACVPMDDPDAAVAEVEYACTRLGALGVQIYTHVHGHPMDEARFGPFYSKMAELDRLIQVHPCRSAAWPDYPTERQSRYEIWWVFGWEYDLSAFMSRMVFGGILERHPTLKFLIHHGGSMVPHFAGRVGPGWDQLGERTPDDQRQLVQGYPLSKGPLDFFKMFYADTALFGAGHALRCTIDFYGTDLVTLVGCGGGGGTGDGTAQGGASAAPDKAKPISIKVGDIQGAPASFVAFGVKKAFFAERGLDVQLVPQQGGAAIIPGLVSGDLQIGGSNVVSMFLARSRGLEVQIISPGTVGRHRPGQGLLGGHRRARQPDQVGAGPARQDDRREHPQERERHRDQ